MSEQHQVNPENTERDAPVANVSNSGNSKVVVSVNTDQDQAQKQAGQG
ncbi:spore protein [Bacillus mexicanus]|nr:spore protein [Bacillus sp. SKDU12]